MTSHTHRRLTVFIHHVSHWIVPLLAAGLALALGGCATMSAYRAESAKWQAMADRATTALDVAPATVHVTGGHRGQYVCAERRIDLGTDQTERGARWVLAHELGHHFNGDCREGVFAHEVRADLLAVRVLETWGLTEYEAAKEAATWLWWVAKKGRATGMLGHDACAEMVAVLRAYPAVSNPTDGTCAAELARPNGGK